MELPADLIGIIGTFAIPTVTYLLVTLSPELASRFGYSQRGFWRDKVCYETRGPVFDDAVVSREGSNYHTYYRIVNQREFGRVGLLNRESGEIVPITDGAIGVWASRDHLYVAKPRSFAIYWIEEKRPPAIQYEIQSTRRIIQAGTVTDRTGLREHALLQEDGQIITIRLEYPQVKVVLVSNPVPATRLLSGSRNRPPGAGISFEAVPLDRDGTIWELGPREEPVRIAWEVTWMSESNIYGRSGDDLVDPTSDFPIVMMASGLGLSGRPTPDHGSLLPPSCRWWQTSFGYEIATLQASLGVDGVVRIQDVVWPRGSLASTQVKLANGESEALNFAVIY